MYTCLRFLVLPLIESSGGYTPDKVLELNSGPDPGWDAGHKDYSHLFMSAFLPLQSLEDLRKEVKEGAGLTGAALLRRAKDLTREFYHFKRACLAEGAPTLRAGAPPLSRCGSGSAAWSSLAPDPKSEIRGEVDAESGMLV